MRHSGACKGPDHEDAVVRLHEAHFHFTDQEAQMVQHGVSQCKGPGGGAAETAPTDGDQAERRCGETKATTRQHQEGPHSIHLRLVPMSLLSLCLLFKRSRLVSISLNVQIGFYSLAETVEGI